MSDCGRRHFTTTLHTPPETSDPSTARPGAWTSCGVKIAKLPAWITKNSPSAWYKSGILLRIIVLPNGHSVVERRTAHSLAPFRHILHVEILPVGLPLGIGQRLRPVTLHQRIDSVAVQFIASVGHVRKIRSAQVVEGQGNLRSERVVPPRVLQPIQNHRSSSGQEFENALLGRAMTWAEISLPRPSTRALPASTAASTAATSPLIKTVI